jgi:phenylacetate-CoA ligase
VNIPLTLKYAGRHALKRNALVTRWCDDLISRECVDPVVHQLRQAELLGHVFRAARRIPAYTPYAAGAPERDSLAFLVENFPIIDKAILLERRTEFLPHGRVPGPGSRFNVAATSGTTGTPLDVYRSFESMLREEAFHLQHWHWAGWRRGQRQALLRGDTVVPIDRRQPPFWFHDSVGGQLVLSTRHLDEDTAVLFARALDQYGVTQLRAYPSAAYQLATFCERAGVPVRLNSVITGSEMLYGFQRARIESVFRAKVYDFYSMTERVAYASECEHGRMHVNPEYGFVEIVDEQGKATDGEGTIVGTTLHNHYFPLIRYRTNDTARWSREPCPCGRSYPVIDRISGRLADQLFDLDGRAVNCTVIGFAFDGMRNIRKGQVAQVAADRWVIRIVPGPAYSQDDGKRVLEKLAAEVSPRVAASIELADEIPALPSGKYKWVSQEYTPMQGSAVSFAAAGSREPEPQSGSPSVARAGAILACLLC